MPIHDPHLMAAPEPSRNPLKYLPYTLPEIRKAITGALAAGIPLLATDLADMHLSRAEGGALVGAMLLGGYAVFKVKNRPSR